TEVGAVNFMGGHPDWSSERDEYPDPLYIGSIGYAFGKHRQWVEMREYYGDDVGSFCVTIAPDYYHKADVSGGPAYCIRVPDESADGTIQNEPNSVTLVGYLRLAFR